MNNSVVARKRLLMLMGVIVSAAVALVIPGTYAAIAYLQEADALSFKARLNAGRVAKYIYAQGPMWQFHRGRLVELIEINEDRTLNQRIYQAAGKLVAEEGIVPRGLPIMRSAPIIVAGQSVGRIETEASALPIVKNASLIFVASSLFGLMIYVFLNRVRLRILNRTLDSLNEREKQLADQNMHFSSALENMPHGLCMFDSLERVIVCNANYARMYGLSDELVKSGGSLQAILAACAANGSLARDSNEHGIEMQRQNSHQRCFIERELLDGRIISIIRQPMPNGGWVSVHMDVTEKKQAEQKIIYLAHHDALTGLPNRLLLRQHIQASMTRAVRNGESVAVLCLDLDHFKNVNDTLGHPVGDTLLCAVSQRLRECLRETDIVARTGGDEFSIVQAGAEQPEAAAALAKRIVSTLSLPFDLGEHQVVIGTSVGIAMAPVDGTEPNQLLKNADLAMYRAKTSGRGMYCFFAEEMDIKAQARRLLELDLRRAVTTGEFELYYQPIVNLDDHNIIGFEALLRWNHPARGRISPDDFIPLAEETGLIIPIGQWVIEQACTEANSWPGDLRVAVNVSPVQFRSRTLASAVVAALAKSGLSPARLELEITEAVLLHDNEATLAVLHQLRNLGVKISMDDFGTGYSSLSYLRSFPFDKIKIDQSFIRALAGNPDSIAIIRAVSDLGKSFGMVTTAEGVETQAELDQMRAEGCTEVQGYFYGRPTPAQEISGVLASFRKLAKMAA